jgi:multiple sugar transport system ATP-binding protein
LADVVLENLSKHYGEVKAVDNISLKIADRELLILLGPSGSGKTTAMRLIAGLETPTSGRILIDGILVNDLPPRDRDIAMVFQSYALYPHMTVYDNIAFPLRMRKMPKAEIKEKVKKAADVLDISRLLERKPKQLSGGEQQRVALGRAIVREPKVFLMDEPLSNLDAKLRLYMRAELKALQKRLGITTVYVTHDQLEAMTMADRIALIDRGSLLQTGSPDEIYSHPATDFVGGFIGSPPMNFINCRIQSEKNRLFLTAPNLRLDVSEWQKAIEKVPSGSEVTMGIRPEDLSIISEESEDVIRGEVYVVEPLGSEEIVNVKVNETMIKVKSPPNLRISPGTRARMSVNVDNLHIFDKKTGETII